VRRRWPKEVSEEKTLSERDFRSCMKVERRSDKVEIAVKKEEEARKLGENGVGGGPFALKREVWEGKFFQGLLSEGCSNGPAGPLAGKPRKEKRNRLNVVKSSRVLQGVTC